MGSINRTKVKVTHINFDHETMIFQVTLRVDEQDYEFEASIKVHPDGLHSYGFQPEMSNLLNLYPGTLKILMKNLSDFYERRHIDLPIDLRAIVMIDNNVS
jgi:hypothetical protein